MEPISHNGLGHFKGVVDHHRPGIETAFHDALKRLNAYPPELRAEWNALTFAVVMHSHVCHAMRRVFAGVPGATPGKEKARAFILELDGAPLGIPEVVQLKCKQFDYRLLTSNIPTDAVKAFNSRPVRREVHVQLALDPSFGPPKTVYVDSPSHGNVGYILDELKTGFERLGVTYMTGLRSAEWVLELSTGTRAEIVNLPLGEIKEEAQKKTRVKGRRTAAQELPKKRVNPETLIEENSDEFEMPKKKEL